MEDVKMEIWPEFFSLVSRLLEVEAFFSGEPSVRKGQLRGFMEYKEAILTREMVYEKYMDSMGNSTFNEASAEDRRLVKQMSENINVYERVIRNTPIYDKLTKRFGAELPEFLRQDSKDGRFASTYVRDEKGRWIADKEFVPTEAGWYQDREGKLYKYDGVVWDEVPAGRLSELEYLG